MTFASPDTAPGTAIEFERNGRYARATVVGPDPKNTAQLVVDDGYSQWVVHWAYTRLAEPATVQP